MKSPYMYTDTLTTPASGFLLRPLLKVDARVEEQLSSYRALPSFSHIKIQPRGPVCLACVYLIAQTIWRTSMTHSTPCKQCVTIFSTHPYLSGTLEPMLCCKLVRLILRVLVQLNQKMVRERSFCSLCRKQQRVQQHYKSHGCPMSGRSTHRVCLVSIRVPGRRAGISVRAAPR
ncbi:hypothetical protein EYF80_011311 [Liparis tanakae]|uniref:Uncharacterized protein n=1 Tax=Liparis tanakae TaxID=230148 RepID=A0A4Z2ILD2_9TELE|nr:hypothetical protein EYF80_011311 [Liparis tanakae]